MYDIYIYIFISFQNIFNNEKKKNNNKDYYTIFLEGKKSVILKLFIPII